MASMLLRGLGCNKVKPANLTTLSLSKGPCRSVTRKRQRFLDKLRMT